MSKKKQQKQKNTSTKNNTQETEEWSIQTSVKTSEEFRHPRKVIGFCSTSRTRLITNVIKVMIPHDRWNDGILLQWTEHMHGHLWLNHYVMFHENDHLHHCWIDEKTAVYVYVCNTIVILEFMWGRNGWSDVMIPLAL